MDIGCRSGLTQLHVENNGVNMARKASTATALCDSHGGQYILGAGLGRQEQLFAVVFKNERLVAYMRVPVQKLGKGAIFCAYAWIGP